MDIIKTMRESDNLLLKTEADDLAKWKGLKHNKESLELFLNNNIAEIMFLCADKKHHSIICTANTVLINILSLKKKEDKKKLVVAESRGISTKGNKNIKLWDLVEHKFKTVPLTSWKIVNFITISKENILLLDTTINDTLRK